MKNNDSDQIFCMINKLLHIDATLDQPGLLENLVEKLASRRYDIGFSNEVLPKDWLAVEVSSAETYASGTLSFSGTFHSDDAAINMPFITPMLFTCVKEKNNDYKLLWSCSLS